MRRTMRTRLSLLLMTATLFLAATMVFAAGSKEAAASMQAQGPETIRLAWWGGDARHKATIDAADAFMKKYPQITVKTEYQGFEGYYDKLITQIAAGTGPDAFQFITAWFGDVRKSPEMFYDLRKLAGLDLSGWNQSTLDTMSLDGKLIGLPQGQNARILVYNKDLADKLGVDVQKYPTWKGFNAAVQAARAKDPSIYGYSGIMDQYYYPLIGYLDQVSGNEFITKDVKFGFSEQQLVDGLTMFHDWFQNGTFEPLDKTVLLKNAWSDPAWLNGNVLFNETPVTQLGQQMKYPFKVGLTRYWVADGAKLTGNPVGPNMMFSVNSQTKHADAVAKLMNFFHSDPAGVKALELQRGVPSNKAAYDILVNANMIDDMTKTAMKIVTDSDTGEYTFLDPNEIRDTMETAIQNVGLKGGTTPEAAAKQFIAAGNRILQNFK